MLNGRPDRAHIESDRPSLILNFPDPLSPCAAYLYSLPVSFVSCASNASITLGAYRAADWPSHPICPQQRSCPKRIPSDSRLCNLEQTSLTSTTYLLNVDRSSERVARWLVVAGSFPEFPQRACFQRSVTNTGSRRSRSAAFLRKHLSDSGVVPVYVSSALAATSVRFPERGSFANNRVWQSRPDFVRGARTA